MICTYSEVLSHVSSCSTCVWLSTMSSNAGEHHTDEQFLFPPPVDALCSSVYVLISGQYRLQESPKNLGKIIHLPSSQALEVAFAAGKIHLGGIEKAVEDVITACAIYRYTDFLLRTERSTCDVRKIIRTGGQ